MSETRRDKVPIDLISRVLSGEADRSEQEKLIKWENQSAENSQIIEQYRILWQRSGNITPMSNIDVEEEWSKYKLMRDSRFDDKRWLRKLSPLTKIAAAASIAVIISFSGLLTFNSTKYKTIVAEAEVAEIALPDGSLAVLYPGSEIKYPKKFKAGSRNVIMEGEVFFDVARDTLRSFSVSAGDMIVKVLGTTFNIVAYKSSDIYNVIVEKGQVAVFSSSNQDILEYLEGGEQATFSELGKEILKSKNMDINYNAWRTNTIVFRDSDLAEIASILSKVYLVDIEVISNHDDQILSVTFDNKPLDYILETIEATLDIKIDKEEEKIFFK